MVRSNNQLRRTAKATGRVFVPKVPRSKTLRNARKQKLQSAIKNKKLPYSQMRNKGGKVTKRIFRAGGYNFSGKFGKASAVKAAAKENKKKAGKSKSK